jgi:hypothetical protein
MAPAMRKGSPGETFQSTPPTVAAWAIAATWPRLPLRSGSVAKQTLGVAKAALLPYGALLT